MPPPIPGIPERNRIRQPSRPSLEVDEQFESDAQMARNFRPGISVPWAVVTACITAVTSVLGTYFATHAATPDGPSKGDFNALDKRISQQGEDIRNLTQTVNRNADQAHNDTAILNGMLLTLTRQK
jgi:hypothetical protein